MEYKHTTFPKFSMLKNLEYTLCNKNMWLFWFKEVKNNKLKKLWP